MVQIVIHTPKNLQQGDPKTDFLSEDFRNFQKEASFSEHLLW